MRASETELVQFLLSRLGVYGGCKISPKPFLSPLIDWLAWLGLASLASAWLVSSAATTTTATTLHRKQIKRQGLGAPRELAREA